MNGICYPIKNVGDQTSGPEPGTTVAPDTVQSSTWSGVVDYGNCYYLHGEFDIARVSDAPCPSNAEFTNWVGLDGWNNSTLEQAGVFYPSGGKSPYLFWQAINGSYNTYTQPVSHPFQEGERLAASVNFHPGEPGGPAASGTSAHGAER